LPGEQPHDLPDPDAAMGGQQVLEIPQLRVHRVDEVTENVDLAPLEKGRELDPGHETHSEGPVGIGALHETGHRVVVGQRPRLGTGRCRPCGDHLGRVLSVGSSRMSM
jgi:hypothetical protein